MKKLEGKKPLIRFPEFEGLWEHKQLSELLSVSKAKNLDLKYDKSDVLSVSGELGIVNQIKHLGRSYAGASVHNYGLVEIGDIVYTKSPLKANPYGIIKINKGQAGIVSTLYAVYKVKSKSADGTFLDHYFSLDANTNRYLRPLVRKGAKNDMKINNSYVLNDRIFVPSLAEQRKISHFFNLIDNRIKALEEEKGLMEKYKKGVTRRIFDLSIRFIDSNGQNYPEWREFKLGSIGNTYSGLSGKTKVDFGSGKPYITYKQIFDSTKIDTSKFDFVEIGTGENQNCVKYGDVFFTTSSETPREIGYSSVLLDEIPDLYLNSFCFGYRIKSFDVLLPQFAQFLFMSNPFREQVYKLAQGSTRYNMSKRELMKTKVLLPVKEEQNQIANFLSLIDKKITLLSDQIKRTKEYKNGLLQQMFAV